MSRTGTEPWRGCSLIGGMRENASGNMVAGTVLTRATAASHRHIRQSPVECALPDARFLYPWPMTASRSPCSEHAPAMARPASPLKHPIRASRRRSPS
jgi:hypothetical protein